MLITKAARGRLFRLPGVEKVRRFVQDEHRAERVDEARTPNQPKRSTHVAERPVRDGISQEQFRLDIAIRRGFRELPRALGPGPVPVGKEDLRRAPETEIRQPRVERRDVVEAPIDLRPCLSRRHVVLKHRIPIVAGEHHPGFGETGILLHSRLEQRARLDVVLFRDAELKPARLQIEVESFDAVGRPAEQLAPFIARQSEMQPVVDNRRGKLVP